MPFYDIEIGFRLSTATARRISSQGFSFPFPYAVRVVAGGRNEVDNTILTIEADTQAIAREWKQALLLDLGSVEAYEPPPNPGADPPPDPLNIWARTGQWAKSVGNATTLISSLPGEPRGLILWGSGIADSALDSPDPTGGAVVFGFSDGTNSRDMAYVSQNDQTTTNANSSIGNVAFHLVDPAGTSTTHIKEHCSAVTFSAVSFALTWNATTLATTGNYFVFGGSDIQNVLVKDYEVGTTISGGIDYIGLGFAPSLSLLLYPSVSGGLPWPTTITGTDHALNSISVNTNGYPENSWSLSNRAQDNVSLASTSRLQRQGYTLSGMLGTSATEQQYARFSIGNPLPDGFRLEWFNAPVDANTIFTGLFVKGGNWDIGKFYQPTEPGTVRTLLENRYAKIQGIMGFSVNNTDLTNENVGTTGAKMTIGAQDSTGAKACLVYTGANNVSPTTEVSILNNTKFMRYV